MIARSYCDETLPKSVEQTSEAASVLTAKIQGMNAFEMDVKLQSADICGVLERLRQDFLN